jgi:hypothetical protein
MSKQQGWVSLELWDNYLEDCVARWNQNKWGLSKDHKSNIKEVFFYGMVVKHEGKTEIFSFTDGYIFLNLKDKTKLPGIGKIQGALDWVTLGPRESNTNMIYVDDAKIDEMREFVKNKVSEIMDSLEEGAKYRVTKGLYKGMEGMLVGKTDYEMELEFYLNSKSVTASVPFWFTNYSAE